MEVYLDEFEWWSACYTGMLIQADSVARGLRDKLMKPNSNPVREHQIGTLGERAVAKALDLYWSGAGNTYGEPDLSHLIEVRTIQNPGLGMKVKPMERGDKRVVGVLVPDDLSARKLKILGWLVAADAKRPEWRKDPGKRGPAYWVPLDKLRPMDELRRIVNQERGG